MNGLIVIGHDFSRFFDGLLDLLLNNPFSLGMILLAPAFFTFFVFVSWVLSENEGIKNLQKFNNQSAKYKMSHLGKIIVINEDTRFLNEIKSVFEKNCIDIFVTNDFQQLVAWFQEFKVNNVLVGAVIISDSLFNQVELGFLKKIIGQCKIIISSDTNLEENNHLEFPHFANDTFINDDLKTLLEILKENEKKVKKA